MTKVMQQAATLVQTMSHMQQGTLRGLLQVPGKVLIALGANPLATAFTGGRPVGETRLAPVLNALGDRTLAEIPEIFKSNAADFILQVATHECAQKQNAQGTCMMFGICKNCGEVYLAEDQMSGRLAAKATAEQLLQMSGRDLAPELPQGTLLHAIAVLTDTRRLAEFGNMMQKDPLTVITGLMSTMLEAVETGQEACVTNCPHCGSSNVSEPVT